MAEQDPARDVPPTGDPWHAFGYLVSGVGFYGLLGWLADRWLGTTFLVAVGILFGACLGVWMTWTRFKPGLDQLPSPRDVDPNVTTQEKQ